MDIALTMRVDERRILFADGEMKSPVNVKLRMR